MVFNFQKEKLISELKRIKPKKVLIQLAEGIKQNAFEIDEIFERLNIETIYSGETAWGGCSVAISEAKFFNADLIVHFGHAKFLESDFPVLYIEIEDDLNLATLLEKSLKKLKEFESIGLSYSVQHRHDLEKIKRFYEENGKKVILSEKCRPLAYEGHVLGCSYCGLKRIEEKVDAFVIVGNHFHSMGAVLSVNKPVFLVDVYNDKIIEHEDLKEKTIKQRGLAIEKFKEAKNVGIIIEAKLGQQFGSHNFLRQKIKDKGKKVIIIEMNEITPEKLMNFYSVDVFIELACPRIAIDDVFRYEKPLLTYREALVGLGETSWEDFLKEGVL